MFLEIQIFALESRFVFLRAANVFFQGWKWCRETPGGAHGETMGPHAPPLPLKGIDTYLLALNTAAKAEVRHAVMAIKHLSCLSLKRGALMSWPAWEMDKD